MLVAVFPGDTLSTEPCACVGIEVKAPGSTPSGEYIGIDVDFLEGLAITPELVHDAFCALEPFAVSCWKIISIDK